VPRDWLRNHVDSHARKSNFLKDGIRASTGGNRIEEPYRSASINGLEDPRCLGRVFKNLPPKVSRPYEPLLRLQVEFVRSTTSSSDWTIIDRTAPQTTQVVAITYEKPGSAEHSRFIPGAPGEARRPVGDGWRSATRKILGSPDMRPLFEQVLFDERNSPKRWRLHDYDGYTWLSLRNFEVPVSGHAHVSFSLAHTVPPERWRAYRAKAVALYTWLRTLPRERGAAPRVF
jgi:hypothetical protein